MDFAGMVRVAKQNVRLATRGLDPHGELEPYLAEIAIRISRRGGPGIAGRAGMFRSLGRGDIGYILINVGVCYNEQRFMKTLYHELAHAVCSWLYGPRHGHGEAWRAIMVQLGQKPERCHDYMDRV